MLKRKTLFIIGAGAGDGLLMPLGDKLSEIIADDVAIEVAYDGSVPKGDKDVNQALLRAASLKSTGMDALNRAGHEIANGIRYTHSIDNYVNAHSDNEAVKIVAKIAIVHAILVAEQASYLWIDEGAQPAKFRNGKAVHNSWLNDFFQLLHEDIIDQANLVSIFDNLAIINFNYDRCIEHFLLHALRTLFPSRDRKFFISLINEKLKILHPYGVVGRLPWQGGTQQPVQFGGVKKYGQGLAELSDEIRTYNEQLADNAELAAIRTEVAEAETIIFLGFHFHRQNMELLTISQLSKFQPTHVYGTTCGRSNTDIGIISERIYTTLKSRSVFLEIDGNRNCKDIFREYGTSFSSP